MDTSIITIFVSALGGALVSSLAGFLTIYFNNKHSFRMVKEKDKYEYGQYTNRMLYKYLEELERESQLVTHPNAQETLVEAYAGREKIQLIYSLVKPFLCDDTIILLDTFSSSEVHSFRNFHDITNEKYMQTGNKNLTDDDMVKLNEWFANLNGFRKDLVASIQKELRRIKNSRE